MVRLYNRIINTELPPKEAFCSKWKKSSILHKEYKQAIDCWNNTGCNTIEDCMMLYHKTDVILSLDVFEKFRDNCLEYYRRLLLNIFYSWIDMAMWLKHTSVELIKKIHLIFMIQNNLLLEVG